MIPDREIESLRAHLLRDHATESIATSLADLRAVHMRRHPHYWHTGSCDEARCGWRRR